VDPELAAVIRRPDFGEAEAAGVAAPSQGSTTVTGPPTSGSGSASGNNAAGYGFAAVVAGWKKDQGLARTPTTPVAQIPSLVPQSQPVNVDQRLPHPTPFAAGDAQMAAGSINAIVRAAAAAAAADDDDEVLRQALIMSMKSVVDDEERRRNKHTHAEQSFVLDGEIIARDAAPASAAAAPTGSTSPAIALDDVDIDQETVPETAAEVTTETTETDQQHYDRFVNPPPPDYAKGMNATFEATRGVRAVRALDLLIRCLLPHIALAAQPMPASQCSVSRAKLHALMGLITDLVKLHPLIAWVLVSHEPYWLSQRY
jgi:hypothetical protein